MRILLPIFGFFPQNKRMPKNFIACCFSFGLVLTFSGQVLANEVIVTVAKSKRGACLQRETQATVRHLTVKETIKAIEDYVHQRNISEVFASAFSGKGLKFCGTEERKEVFGHLIRNLKVGEPPPRLFEFMASYSNSETLLEIIQKELRNKNLTKLFENNLKRAESVILEQRKGPSSGTPTDT